MNNLLFIALCLALIYYFFYPPQTNNANLPFKQNKAVQTEEPIFSKRQVALIKIEWKKQIDELEVSKQKLLEEIEELKKQLELLSKEKKEDEKTINLLIQEENTKLNRVLTLLGIEGVVFSGEEAALLIKRWIDQEKDWFSQRIETIRNMVWNSIDLKELREKFEMFIEDSEGD